MSQAREILPILIDATREDDDLIVRIDLDPESKAPAESTLLTIHLKGCGTTEADRQELERSVTTLAENVGMVADYQMVDDPDQEFRLFIDYGRECFFIPYEDISELRDHPDPGLLHQRVQRLASLLDYWTERHRHVNQQHQRLIADLTKATDRESDVAERKLPFLREKDSPSAIAVEARAAAFERVRQIVEENSTGGM